MSCASRLAVVLLGFSAAAAADTAPWRFGAPLTVADARPGVFHHLESAGRQGIAVSGDTVALVWEDNRDGTPRAYVAFRAGTAPEFGSVRLSGAGEAYEPVVTSLGDGRFVFGWEESGQVWVRSGGPQGLDPPVRLDRGGGAQPTLAHGERGVYAAWAEQAGKVMTVRAARLTPGAGGKPLTFTPPVSVAPASPADQLYPALAVLRAGVVVAWEDRRHGHTVIYAARTHDDRRFLEARPVYPLPSRTAASDGLGPGAARVVLARLGANGVAAAWLDKRGFEGGYDIYAAVSRDGGRTFGTHRNVEDEFGRSYGQWHASLAVDAHGRQVCAWDDDRDGSPDLWLSWRTGGPWSADLAVPGASGAAAESSPVLTLDRQGALHLAWIERAAEGAPTRLRYLRAEPVPAGP